MPRNGTRRHRWWSPLKFLKGYKWDHWRRGIQLGTAIGACTTIAYIKPVHNFFLVEQGSATQALWIVYVAALVAVNDVGASFKRCILGVGGVAMGAVGASLIIICVSAVSQFHRDSVLFPIVVVLLLSVLEGLIMLQRARFPNLEFMFEIALLITPALSLPGIHLRGYGAHMHFITEYKVALASLIGVTVTIFINAVVFPTHAVTRLEHHLAGGLERMGNLVFNLQAVFTEKPGPGGSLPGMSGTDVSHNLVDDGLEQRYESLTQQECDLSASLNFLTDLVSAASAEHFLSKLLMMAPPSASKHYFVSRMFPRKKAQPHAAYLQVIRAMSRVLTSILSVHHLLETGVPRLSLCWDHVELLQAVQYCTADVVTALAGCLLGRSSEEYAFAKLRDLHTSQMNLVQALENEPLAAFGIQVETLAVFIKSARAIARQLYIMYRLIRPEGVAKLHDMMLETSVTSANDDVEAGFPRGDHDPDAAGGQRGTLSRNSLIFDEDAIRSQTGNEAASRPSSRVGSESHGLEHVAANQTCQHASLRGNGVRGNGVNASAEAPQDYATSAAGPSRTAWGCDRGGPSVSEEAENGSRRARNGEVKGKRIHRFGSNAVPEGSGWTLMAHAAQFEAELEALQRRVHQQVISRATSLPDLEALCKQGLQLNGSAGPEHQWGDAAGEGGDGCHGRGLKSGRRRITDTVPSPLFSHATQEVTTQSPFANYRPRNELGTGQANGIGGAFIDFDSPLRFGGPPRFVLRSGSGEMSLTPARSGAILSTISSKELSSIESARYSDNPFA